MTDTERGLLDAIRSNQADDTPRLIYADYLDGLDTDDGRRRAEFIRVQVELARRPDSEPLRERSLALLEEQHTSPPYGLPAWLWPHAWPDPGPAIVLLPDGFVGVARWHPTDTVPIAGTVEFRRGFVAELRDVSPAGFLPHAEAVVAGCPGLERVGMVVRGEAIQVTLYQGRATVWCGGWQRGFGYTPADEPAARVLDPHPLAPGYGTAALVLSRWLGVRVTVTPMTPATGPGSAPGAGCVWGRNFFDRRRTGGYRGAGATTGGSRATARSASCPEGSG